MNHWLKTGIALIFIMALLACGPGRSSKSAPIPSPSGNYSIQTTILPRGGSNGLHIQLHLNDANGTELDTAVTYAYDPMKWGGKWHDSKDIYCIYGSDAGSYEAFSITADKLTPTTLTQELVRTARIAMEDKYGPRYNPDSDYYRDIDLP